jgi:hypothetical protein
VKPYSAIAMLVWAASLSCCDRGSAPDPGKESREGKARLAKLEAAYERIDAGQAKCLAALDAAVKKHPSVFGPKTTAAARKLRAPVAKAALSAAAPIQYDTFGGDKGRSAVVPLDKLELPPELYAAGKACAIGVESLEALQTKFMTHAAYPYGPPDEVDAAIKKAEAAKDVKTPAMLVARIGRCKPSGTTEYVQTTPGGDQYQVPTSVSTWQCELGYVWVDVDNGQLLASVFGNGVGKPARAPSEGSNSEIKSIDQAAFKAASDAAKAQITKLVAMWP